MAYYKVLCPICGKSHPNRAECPLVTQKGIADSKLAKQMEIADSKLVKQQEIVDSKLNNKDVATLLYREGRDRSEFSTESKSIRKSIRNQGRDDDWKWDEKTGCWFFYHHKNEQWQKWHSGPKKATSEASARRPSDAMSVGSSVSTAASTVAPLTWSKKPLQPPTSLAVASAPALARSFLEAASDPAPASASASASAPAPAPALPAQSKHEDAVSADPAVDPAHSKLENAVYSSEVTTKSSNPTLRQMVETIREQLELDAWTYDTMSKVIAEANLQLGLPAVGTFSEQASSLLREFA